MRNPSLHVTQSDLIILLQEVQPNKHMVWHDDIMNYQDFAKALINKGKAYTCTARGVLVSNDKLLKKTNKLSLANRSNTALFAQILLLVRQQFKHRGITMIKVGDPDWLNLKECSKLGTEFCNEFSLSLKIGYKVYITLGMKKMKNFSIFKFKTLHAAIFNEHEALQVIEQDKTPNKTEEAHNIYLAKIADKIGYATGYKDNPEKYQYFVKAKEEANKYSVSVKIYITAQFVGLEWANSIPDPVQLIGVKAIERLQKYAFTNDIELGNKKNTINWDKIRKHGKNNSK